MLNLDLKTPTAMIFRGEGRRREDVPHLVVVPRFRRAAIAEVDRQAAAKVSRDQVRPLIARIDRVLEALARAHLVARPNLWPTRSIGSRSPLRDQDRGG